MKYISIARIEVDSNKLEEYKNILKEEIEASLSLEDGVDVLYPVWDKENPGKFTILEVYDSEEVYKRHCTTPHLKKYFDLTKDMVKSLEITECIPMFDDIKMTV